MAVLLSSLESFLKCQSFCTSWSVAELYSSTKYESLYSQTLVTLKMMNHGLFAYVLYGGVVTGRKEVSISGV